MGITHIHNGAEMGQEGLVDLLADFAAEVAVNPSQSRSVTWSETFGVCVTEFTMAYTPETGIVASSKEL